MTIHQQIMAQPMEAPAFDPGTIRLVLNCVQDDVSDAVYVTVESCLEEISAGGPASVPDRLYLHAWLRLIEPQIAAFDDYRLSALYLGALGMTAPVEPIASSNIVSAFMSAWEGLITWHDFRHVLRDELTRKT